MVAIGRKPVLLTGLLLFALGSAACGLAPSLPLLVAFRVVQGAGSALVLALADALLVFQHAFQVGLLAAACVALASAVLLKSRSSGRF